MEYLDKTGLQYLWSKIKNYVDTIFSGPSEKTNAILYGSVDATSTATAFTATIEGLTSLYDGVTIMLHNGVVTSASGFTIDINGLGALPVYSNMAAGNTVTPTDPTRETTIFNINYTMLFIYSSTIVSGGGWICYRGYDANTNTIGYQLRTNSTARNVSDTARYYKLYFTSADNTMWVPASVDSTGNATAARPVNQRPIDPFGPIVYTSSNVKYAAGATLTATTIWEQYALVLGYSFNRTGAALNLTVKAPVYVRCAPQADGSAIMDADTPIVQALPTSKDGKIYIYLGIAYDATHIELVPKHPVYWHDGNGIRLWTGAEPSSGGSTVSVSQTLTSGTEIGSVSVDGTATKLYAPTPQSITVDSELSSTSENPVQNKVINSAIAAKYTKPSSGIPESDLVSGIIPPASSARPYMDGTASAGTAGAWSRADHVHPTDTSRQAALVSGTNIKTINNTSLLGSGNISTKELPTVSASDNGKVLTVASGAWAANDVAMTDSEIEAAVDAGWVTLISFTIDGTTYQAADGMTWEEWMSSAYNVDGYVSFSNSVGTSDHQRVVMYDNYTAAPLPTDEIIANKVYETVGGND